jgi:CubicO group peptidase (beta-lactamase class C family)
MDMTGWEKRMFMPRSQYNARYKDALPEEYAGADITFRQLLTHTSGVPHLSQLWDGEKLKVDFKPGTSVQYSSNGFGILGDVMEEVTGKSYSQLIQDYIAEPIGAESFGVLIPAYLAPAGQVASDIEDMSRFGIGVMEGKYFDNDILCNQVLKEYSKNRFGSIGLGWYCTNLDSEDLAGYHAGSNGRPRAFLAIKPYKKNAVALTGLCRSDKNPQVFSELTIDLMAIIENRDTDKPKVED